MTYVILNDFEFFTKHIYEHFLSNFFTLKKVVTKAKKCYYKNMKIVSAKYLTSVVEASKLLSDGVCEFAFVGRSNVGKSSLINNLCSSKSLAKTSSTPGATRMINYFDINNGQARFVDLPGYGYHKAGKQNEKMWAGLIEDYLLKSQNLKLVLFLLDIRHEPSQLDKMMFDFLLQTGRNFVIVATKADKLSKAQQYLSKRKIAASLKVREELIFLHSSLNSQGKSELLDYLDA